MVFCAPPLKLLIKEQRTKYFASKDPEKLSEFSGALDDEHRNQAAAQKLLLDRMLPISVCDKNADIREKITININSVEIPECEEEVINQCSY